MDRIRLDSNTHLSTACSRYSSVPDHLSHFFQRGYLSIVAAYSPCAQDACSIPTFCDKQTGWVLSLPLCTRQSTTGRTWKNNLKNLYLIAIKLNCAPVSLFFLGQDLSNFTQAKEMPPSIAYEEPHFAQPELWSNCAVVV